jgi:hypothetical protein
MSTYEPGQVAVATVRGVPNVRVLRSGGDREAFWIAPTRTCGDRYHADSDVTDIRPLVVLDLDDFAWAAKVLRHPMVKALGTRTRIAEQIEEQTKPRIPEPGLWGVVSVERPDGLTDYYTCGPGGWFSERGEHFNWESLPGTPTLVRPGIEDGAS